jgi:predicted DNA-binding protein YlxM (UPF0122 family)
MPVKDASKMSLLYDFYGGLLKERNRKIFHLYYEEDLSLTEIAADTGVSRQAVHEALVRTARSLEEYEDKLGLVAKHAGAEQAMAALDRLADERERDAESAGRLRDIRAMIEDLDL